MLRFMAFHLSSSTCVLSQSAILHPKAFWLLATASISHVGCPSKNEHCPVVWVDGMPQKGKMLQQLHVTSKTKAPAQERAWLMIACCLSSTLVECETDVCLFRRKFQAQTAHGPNVRLHGKLQKDQQIPPSTILQVSPPSTEFDS